MFIPEEGQRIMFVAEAGADGKQPEIRPGQVIKVTRYSPTECLCNLICRMNGPSDMPAGYQNGIMQGFDVFLENVPFGADGRKSAQGTWFLPEYTMNDVSTVTVELEIIHGRERIKAGAVGVVDEQKNTITFQNSDVIGMGQGLDAVYNAWQFLDSHAPRIKLEKDRAWRIGFTRETTEETAEERSGFMKDLRRQQGDLKYRMMRQNGLPSQYETPSLRKAREAMEQESRQQHQRSTDSASVERQDTNTRDDSSVGGMTRLDLEQERRRSSSRPTQAAHR